ncbi:hypothetical protein FA95DRAFT_1565306 [Auriscalpium vulgare]|uniref:Uncharacterized protein n=1 Tax=Auriscalpium vulgare TaxID=40419 RepID=A0ACB8RBR4_9AGAM|nr:hypothetical protein FA95DRAFT_1565306 [Auriscalpium vulgare]
MEDTTAGLNDLCQHLMLKDARDLLIARYDLSPQDVSTPLRVHEKLNLDDRAQLDEADLSVIFDRSVLAFGSAEHDINLHTSLSKISKFCYPDHMTPE